MVIRNPDEEEQTRRRLLEAEAIALLLLLRKRRELAPASLLKSGRVGPTIPALERAIAAEIVSTRQRARVSGLASIEATGVIVGVGAVDLADTLLDVTRAERYARNFVKFLAERQGKAESVVAIDNRLTTIGVTENASAFNAQRTKAAREFASKHSVTVIEIWDAELDRACEYCFSMDGAESINGSGFPGGATPGLAHPRCRCTSRLRIIK